MGSWRERANELPAGIPAPDNEPEEGPPKKQTHQVRSACRKPLEPKCYRYVLRGIAMQS